MLRLPTPTVTMHRLRSPGLESRLSTVCIASRHTSTFIHHAPPALRYMYCMCQASCTASSVLPAPQSFLDIYYKGAGVLRKSQDFYVSPV